MCARTHMSARRCARALSHTHTHVRANTRVSVRVCVCARAHGAAHTRTRARVCARARACAHPGLCARTTLGSLLCAAWGWLRHRSSSRHPKLLPHSVRTPSNPVDSSHRLHISPASWATLLPTCARNFVRWAKWLIFEPPCSLKKDRLGKLENWQPQS